MNIGLYLWQEKCLEQWFANDCRGIVNVVTGAGKTVLAAAAIEKLAEIQRGQVLRVKIVVPKAFLTRMWRYALIDYCGARETDIGIFCGARKDPPSRSFMIYVINSARYTLARHIVDDYAAGARVLLIADECHHYGAEQNSRIFNFAGHIPSTEKIYTLGLSATPYCRNFEEVLTPGLGREIFSYTFFDALKDGIINTFTIFNISVELNGDERGEYDDLSDKLGIALIKLKQKYPKLRFRNNPGFFAVLESIVTGKDPEADDEAAELAASVLLLASKRRETVYLAQARIKCATDLVRMTNRAKKIIIFGERIETAEAIYEDLRREFSNEIGIYHSKQDTNTRLNILRRFEDHETRILISCKTLDEGLNVSETDVGIIVSSTSSERQRVQRLGRVLRKKKRGGPAYFYYLYTENTSEEDEMLAEMAGVMSRTKLINVIDLSYDDQRRVLSNNYYDRLIESVLANQNWDERSNAEFMRNATLGLITCDWLADESECAKRLKAANGRAERNYHISMLLIARARSGLIMG